MSALDQVIPALVSKFSAIPSVTVTPVYTGMPVTDSYDSDLIIVGSDGDPESELVTQFDWEWTNLSQTRRDERGGVVCAVICWTGDVDVTATRNRVFALLELCDAIVNTDPTIGGVAVNSDVTLGTDEVIQDQNGTKVIVSFTVAYWAQV